MIAVFTKYDQFRHNIRMKLEDQLRDPALLNAKVESTFQKEYLSNLRESVPFVCLEGENVANELISTTLMTVP
jgi:hypothetical protein